MAEPGPRLLGNRYELGTLIASGGMGQVWRGRDTVLGRRVAVKLLRSEYTCDPSFLGRFRAEATHAAGLSHPNIAAVYDYGEVTDDATGEQLAYLVLELVDGEPLSTLLREQGPLSPEATLAVLRQTAVALAQAHHVGLVHRDVKPGNILVGPGGHVTITDFGIAWSAGSAPLTEAGQVLGTPQYLSPEVAVGQAPTPASDVYSLGLVGYECLTGEPAFVGDNPVTVALMQVQEQPAPLPADLPAGVRRLVEAAVAKDPGERLPDGDAVVTAIDRVRAGLPIEDDPDDEPAPTRAVPLVGGRRPPPAPSAVRRRLRTLLPAVAALLVGIGVVVAVGLSRGHAPAAQAGDGAVAAQEQQDVVLDAGRYLGRPVEEVAAELAALGLTVDRQAQAVDGAVPGTVTQLDPPDGTLHAGDTVTVYFAAGSPAAPEAPADDSVPPGAGSIGAAAVPTRAPQDAAEAVPEPVGESAGAADPGTTAADPAPTTDETAGTTPSDSAAPTTDAAIPTTSPGDTAGESSSGPEPSTSASSSPSSSPSSSAASSPAAPSSAGTVAPTSDATPSSDGTPTGDAATPSTDG